MNGSVKYIDGLKRQCEQTIAEIVDEQAKRGATVTYTEDGPLIHYNGGCKVLGVCHMDYVDVPHRFVWKKKKNVVLTPRLDDRLGIWILLDVLPRCGINLDLLLTDSEEVGASTAESYKPESHHYNWLAQFDRRGKDVVTYDYDESNWKQALRDSGFTIGNGSFSDISKLEHLKVCGVNVGIGYHHEHTTSCYVDFDQMWHNLALFVRFYKRNLKKKYDHEYDPNRQWYGYGSGYGYGSYRYEYYRGGQDTPYSQWLKSNTKNSYSRWLEHREKMERARKLYGESYKRHDPGYWPAGTASKKVVARLTEGTTEVKQVGTVIKQVLMGKFEDCDVCKMPHWHTDLVGGIRPDCVQYYDDILK